MRTIAGIVVMATAVMAILAVSIVAVGTTFAVTENGTDESTGGRANDSSDVVAGNGSSDNGESAKSGINTAVCGPDAAHACQTSAGQ